MKPASSRATATATFGAGLCSASIRRNRRHNRCCALSAIAITRVGWPVRRACEGAPDARAMLVVPARFHQDPADQRVAHLGDAPAPMLLAAGVLARHQARGRPSTPGPSRSGGSHAAPRGSAWPSACRCRGNSATTRRAPDTAPGRRSPPGARPIPEAGPPCDRSPADSRRRRRARPRASRSSCRPTDDGPASNSAPRSAVRAATATCRGDGDTAGDPRGRHRAPAPGRARPRRRASGGCTTVSSPARPSSASFRASRRFVFTRSPGLRGINAGAMTSQRDARRRDLPLQRVATRTGFVEHVHGPRRLALELPHQAPHRRRLVGQLPRHRRRAVARQHRHEEILLVRVDSDERSNLFHDRLLSMRLWRREALTRDIGGADHLVECDSTTTLR